MGVEDPHSYVEFTSRYQERVLHVFLDHEGTTADYELIGRLSYSEWFLNDHLRTAFHLDIIGRRRIAMDILVHQRLHIKQILKDMHASPLNNI